jgi:two-component system CheB/CheR fusion protein
LAGAGATLIALTGYGQPNAIATARAAGFDEHFVKPVSLDRLTRVPQGLVKAPAARSR